MFGYFRFMPFGFLYQDEPEDLTEFQGSLCLKYLFRNEEFFLCNLTEDTNSSLNFYLKKENLNGLYLPITVHSE